MRNPERGHTKPFAKTLAPGPLFCHVGNCQVLSTANQNLKEGPLSSGFFCFWAVYFLRLLLVGREGSVARNRHADFESASNARFEQADVQP
jgi:hypothetical protein